MLPLGVPIPSSLNQGSPQVVDLTTTVEEQVVTEKPTTSELPRPDSPKTKQQQTTTSSLQNQPSEHNDLSNLESHYSGELPEYQQQKSSFNPTQSTKTPEQTIPESVMEIVATEPVQLTESEPTVSVSHSEPTQHQPCNSDQPSSSSPIQISDQPPIDILDPDYQEEQLVEINEEMRNLVLLRNTPFLPFVYEDSWLNLKHRTLEFIDGVARKCYRIQAHAMKRRLEESHSSQQLQSKPLYLANTPFYAETEYVTRDSKVFKMPKQKVLKQQKESKAREDYLLQRQLALEETVRK